MKRTLGLFTGCLIVAVLTSCQAKPTPAPEPSEQKDPYLIDAPAIDEVVKVQSVPSGASVSFSTGETCKSPCNVTKKSNQAFDVKIEKKGYRSATVTVISHARVTPGSGASGFPTIEQPHLQPNPIKVILEPNFSKH